MTSTRNVTSQIQQGLETTLQVSGALLNVTSWTLSEIEGRVRAISRKKRKRGKGTVVVDGLALPKKLGSVAEAYFDKYGVRIPKEKDKGNKGWNYGGSG